MLIYLMVGLGFLGLAGATATLFKLRVRGAMWIRLMAFFLGMVLVVANLISVVGFPYRQKSGEWGRVIGVPFPLGFHDSIGYDYVGLFAFPSMIGNTLFWLIIPQAFVSVCVKWRENFVSSKQKTG